MFNDDGLSPAGPSLGETTGNILIWFVSWPRSCQYTADVTTGLTDGGREVIQLCILNTSPCRNQPLCELPHYRRSFNVEVHYVLIWCSLISIIWLSSQPTKEYNRRLPSGYHPSISSYGHLPLALFDNRYRPRINFSKLIIK